eukprot:CAMPEP_0114166204 /NCGR_PEP_ID=MMETSP0043_2-20121206/31703_1 /TAXON_ID=464988 /ORGANISM="Hemiselmis andersenii, Strain CCMP644" /LENGTH=68 /DNA_ID=CAMNT_0001263169 /DNA_START=61 /DNA_END=264 /DNA_ORIENTATION=+
MTSALAALSLACATSFSPHDRTLTPSSREGAQLTADMSSIGPTEGSRSSPAAADCALSDDESDTRGID